jgi:hypothetical protein
MTDLPYVDVIAAADVTPEVLEIVDSIVSGWFNYDGPVDWDNFWDRLEGCDVEGKMINLGSSLNSPAMRRIKTHVRIIRKSN